MRKSAIHLAVLLGALLLAAPAFSQDEKSGVGITFLPPPMEGTLSLGIYDKKGKLVRVLDPFAAMAP